MFALNALCIVLSSFFTAWCVGFPFTGALSLYPLQNLKRWYMYNPNDDDDDSLFEDYRAAEIIKHSGLLIILIGQVNNYIVTINIWNDSFGNLKRNQSLRWRQVSIRTSHNHEKRDNFFNSCQWKKSPLDSSSTEPLILNACACHDVVMMQLYCTKCYTLFLNIKLTVH